MHPVKYLSHKNVVSAEKFNLLSDEEKQNGKSTANLRLCEYHFEAKCFMNPKEKVRYRVVMCFLLRVTAIHRTVYLFEVIFIFCEPYSGTIDL